jgi:aminoglycoside/choline kinase family phosphotransferase
MGLQRHLKVAGIFARLTLRDGKPKYLADAPRFIQYIRATAAPIPCRSSPLLKLVDQVQGTQERQRLRVRPDVTDNRPAHAHSSHAGRTPSLLPR